MPIQATLVLGFVGVVAAMICIYILVMPEKKYKTLPPFLKWLSDLFNFRTLWLEAILKFFYVLSTTACVIFGVLLLVSVVDAYYYKMNLAPYGLLLLLLGPVVVRLVYEGSMMLVLLVKNVMDINKKLGVDEPQEPEKPTACPNCGAPVTGDDVAFCSNCGSKIQ